MSPINFEARLCAARVRRVGVGTEAGCFLRAVDSGAKVTIFEQTRKLEGLARTRQDGDFFLNLGPSINALH